MPPIPRKYSRSETMTPGFSRTVEIVLERVPLGVGSLVLDVPCGKGEALVQISAKAGATCIGLDTSRELVRHATRKIDRAELGAKASVVLGDGGRLPLPTGTFDACLSIGGPSGIGGHSISAVLREQARILKPRGFLVLNDIFRDASDPNPWIGQDHPNASEWWNLLRSAGLDPTFFEHFPVSAWDDYHAPMRALVAESRARAGSEALAWADRVEREIESELPRGEWANCGAFVAQKTGGD